MGLVLMIGLGASVLQRWLTSPVRLWIQRGSGVLMLGLAGVLAALVQDEPAEVDDVLIAVEAVGAGTLLGMGYTSLVHGRLRRCWFRNGRSETEGAARGGAFSVRDLAEEAGVSTDTITALDEAVTGALVPDFRRNGNSIQIAR